MLRYRIQRLETLLSRLAALLRGPAPPPRRLQTAQDVIDVLQEQVEAVRADTGSGTLEKARAIAYLAGVARKAIETGTLAARLEMLEAVLKQRQGEATP
jgi:t-SNARE complex subunit (syntaxin)